MRPGRPRERRCRGAGRSLALLPCACGPGIVALRHRSRRGLHAWGGLYAPVARRWKPVGLSRASSSRSGRRSRRPIGGRAASGSRIDHLGVSSRRATDRLDRAGGSRRVCAVDGDVEAVVRPIGGDLGRPRDDRTRAGSPRGRSTMVVPVIVHRPVDRTFWQSPPGWTNVSGQRLRRQARHRLVDLGDMPGRSGSSRPRGRLRIGRWVPSLWARGVGPDEVAVRDPDLVVAADRPARPRSS